MRKGRVSKTDLDASLEWEDASYLGRPGVNEFDCSDLPWLPRTQWGRPGFRNAIAGRRRAQNEPFH